MGYFSRVITEHFICTKGLPLFPYNPSLLGSVLALFYYINPQDFGYFWPLLEIKGQIITKFDFSIYIKSIANCFEYVFV